MKDFLAKVQDAINNFMRGRYGADQLGIALLGISIILTLLEPWLGRVPGILALFLIVVACMRVFSTDRASRRKENQAFMGAIEKPVRWFRRQRAKWENRKTKAYVRCPHCHAEFALPKGKGKLRATCPKCGQKSEHTV